MKVQRPGWSKPSEKQTVAINMLVPADASMNDEAEVAQGLKRNAPTEGAASGQARAVEEARRMDEALLGNLELIEVEGDGDCGFTAVCAQLAQLHGKYLEDIKTNAEVVKAIILSKMKTYLQKHKKEIQRRWRPDPHATAEI